ncbi:MAG TPA: RNA polymerase sigma factor [Flavisolibacter sp.]|nr:RNA polymerase sigma factor [Flavisolibacter sp.]
MKLELTQIIKDSSRGKRQAQNALYDLFAAKMFVVCQRYAKTREEAEEILQEGFIKVFKNIDQFRYAGSFEGWVRKIMVNCALEKYRSKSHLHAILPIDNINHEPLVGEEILCELGRKELMNMIQRLPPVYRMVFNLYVFEGFRHKEIAQLLGISEGTSKSNLSDARTILKRAIGKSFGKEVHLASNF